MKFSFQKPSFQNKKQLISIGSTIFILAAIPVTTYLALNVRQLQTPAADNEVEQYEMKVLSLRYFPTLGSDFDNTRTGMPVGTTMDQIRSRVDSLRNQTVSSLGQATRYHGYSDLSALPSLEYEVIEEKEFLQPIPVSTRFVASSLSPVKSADHFKILNGTDGSIGINNICDYVENQNVKEVWIWFYHTNEVAPIESNMAPKIGASFGSEGFKDISNSLREDDLPRCAKTYTVYDFNYTREVSLHTFGHHLESIFGYLDGPLFASYTRRGAKGTVNACGTVHHPPNIDFATAQGELPYHDDYDYGNEQIRQSNCQNWKPDGTGEPQEVNCHTWQGAGPCNSLDDGGHLKYQIWWMQNMPGMNNGLTYKGKPMPNWWKYIGDWDVATQKPTVAITNLQNGFVATNDLTVNVEANYPKGIEKVEIYVNNEQKPLATTTSAPHTTTIKVLEFPKGTMIIRAKAFAIVDGFGTSTAEVILTGTNNYTDKIAPMIKINSPILGKVYDDNKINFNVEFLDNARIYLAVYDLVNYTSNTFKNGTPPNLSKFNEVQTLSDGVYLYTLGAADYSGNHSDSYLVFYVKADPDNDGFTTKVEDYMGTNSQSHCGTNSWPPDFNNDKVVNVADQGLLASNYAPKGTAKYNKRFDFNSDGAINVGDMGLFVKHLSKQCSGATNLIQPVIQNEVLVPCVYTTTLNNGIPRISISGINNNLGYMLQPTDSQYVFGGNISQFTGQAHASSISADRRIYKCTNSFNFPSGWHL